MKKERKDETPLPVPDFLRKAWEDSKGKETDKLTDEEIQAEIRSARQEKRLKEDRQGESAHEALERAGLIGIVKSGPRDLSMDKKHLAVFGRTAK